jgi:hypothetical protein
MVLSEEERKAKAKESQKKYESRPEVKARIKKRKKEWRLRPEVIARRIEYQQSPEVKAKRREREQKPEVIARRREYQRSPEAKAKRRERQQDPERKAKEQSRKKEYYNKPENKIKIASRDKVTRQNLRSEVCSHYSKIHSNSNIPTCRCCGLNSNIEFLALDHIAGRKEMDSEPELVKLGYSSEMTGLNLLRWIKRNDFPDGFQVLCHNCNFAKGQSKDNKCPHEKEHKN